MTIWEQLAEYQTHTKNIQYKKWLDVSSSHFFSIEFSEEEISFKLQKSIAKKAIEALTETGNHLIYVSTSFYIDRDNQLLSPLFLTPILPTISLKEKKIIWSIIDSNFYINPDLLNTSLQLDFDQINQWIDNQSEFETNSIISLNPALYFNLNTKQFTQNDLKLILESKQESQAIGELFHNKIKLKNIDYQPNFLDLVHAIPMDYSQAKAITAANQQSIIISGPPGTGKSQTIINLALNEINQGKTCAIVSQKLAAVQVIQDRLARLGLEKLAICIEQNQANDKKAILKIEERLTDILEFKEEEIIPVLNHVYYQHCIRTIEEYFNAKKQCLRENNLKNSNINFNNIEIFKWIYPSVKLLGISVEEINKRLADFQSKLLEINCEFENLKFETIGLLFPIYKLLLKLDLGELKQFLKDKEGKKSIQDLNKKIKVIQLKKPVESILSDLSIDKLEFYLDNLKSKKSLLDIFNSKLKLVVSEIESLDKNWSKNNDWQKIEEINRAINYKKWELELKEIDSQKTDFVNETIDKNSIEVLSYIDDKIKAKIPQWILAHQWFIKAKNFEINKRIWAEVFDIYHWIIEASPEFQNIEISNFITNFKLNLSQSINQQEWEELCSSTENFNNIDESDFPILKNYTFREVAIMSSYLRKNYDLFCQFHRDKFAYENLKINSRLILEILNSRKRVITEQRSKLKNNIQFIQKNWSKKRKCPSLQQYLSNLDFEFIQSIHPLFVGTIDSFSQFTPLQMELYDTLIIDESSQVEVMDALPALYRAKKLIVVGDEKQLTPTRFFKNKDINSSHESILDLADEKLFSYQLNYHFRSRFSDLIDYSNQYFYQNNLQTNQVKSTSAIEWVHCKEGIYHQRSNQIEAERIVEKLVEFSKLNFKSSFGIICFSIQQKEMIEACIEKEQISNPLFYKFIISLQENTEKLFIKSIEQVQGDERDIILISSAYGRNPEGKFYQFFGPILSYKGENRLNVLMSRAREKMIFISSIKSVDIHVNNNSSQGLILFKKLFEFLENGIAYSSSLKKESSNYWEYFLNPFRK